jgi:hypothetical protein
MIARLIADRLLNLASMSRILVTNDHTVMKRAIRISEEL